MPAYRNTFTGGIDRDTAIGQYPPNKLYMLKNGRIITGDSLSSGAITNERGTTMSFTVPSLDGDYLDPFNLTHAAQSGMSILGYTNLRDSLIIFSTATTGGLDQIWKVDYNDADDSVQWVSDRNQIEGVIKAHDALGGLPTIYSTGDAYVCSGTGTGWTLDYVYTYNGASWTETIPEDKDYIGWWAVANVLDPVIDYYDPTGGTPAGPILGDRYIASETANGWIKSFIYEYNGATWTETTTPNYTTVYVTTESERHIKQSSWMALTAATASTLQLWDDTELWMDIKSGLGLVPQKHLLYQGDLSFSTLNRIKAISNVENDKTGKVYFTDTVNNLRQFNAYDNELYLQESNDFDLINDVTYGTLHATPTTGGLYKSGLVQYGYQLYNKSGPETAFSPASDLIPLTTKSTSSSSSRNFIGDPYQDPDQEDNTGNAMDIKIKDLDSRFSFLRLVAVHYNLKDQVPEIRAIAELKIPNSQIVEFVDNGIENLGGYTTLEFNTLGGTIFSCNDLAVINNRLAAANLKEEFFDVDFDARAYRYLINATGVDVDGTTYTDLSLIGDEDDCVNDETQTADAGFFQYDSAVYGGTGLNVEYKFLVKSMIIDKYNIELDLNQDYIDANSIGMIAAPRQQQLWSEDSDLDSTYADNVNSYTDYSSPVNKSQLAGYARGETYRFGIVFYDEKGRRSLVKWIGDIRFPEAQYYQTGDNKDYSYISFLEHPNSSGPGDDIPYQTYGHPLGIKFTLTNIPDEVDSYEIVRVRREKKDRSVLSTGLVLPTHNDVDSEDDEYWNVGSLVSDHEFDLYNLDMPYGHIKAWKTGTTVEGQDHVHESLVEFMSPDYPFSRQAPPNNSTLKFCGVTEQIESTEEVGGHFNNSIVRKVTNIQHINTVGDGVGDTISFTVNDSQVLTSDNYGSSFNIDNVNYNPFAPNHANNTGDNLIGRKGIGLTAKLSSSIPTAINGTDYMTSHEEDSVFAVLTVTVSGQYGGNTYASRLNDEYISCGHIKAISIPNQGVSSVYNGDVYIGMFDYLRVFGYLESGRQFSGTTGFTTYMENIIFPVETIYPISHRHDISISKDYSDDNAYLMQEHQGDYAGNGDDEPDLYSQETDLYLINAVYGQENTLRKHYTQLNYEWVAEEEHDARLIISEKKVNGEESDSWLKFLPNNFYDVDFNYGSINAIIPVGEQLVFIQDNAIGATMIDERSLIQDQTGASLVLGTGTLFGRHQYISTSHGTQHRDSVINGKYGMYFYDVRSDEVYSYNGQGEIPITSITKMNSYLREELNNDTGCIAGYDVKDDRVYFTFDSPTTTFAYNERLKAVESFYNMGPVMWLQNRHRLLSIALNGETMEMYPSSVYLHGSGPYTSYYEGGYHATELGIIINPEQGRVKVYDTIEYYINSTIDGDEYTENLFPVQFDQIKVETDYGDSGWLNLGTSNSGFRFRKWRAQIPRMSGARTVGNHMVLWLRYSNNNNAKININEIITHFRIHAMPFN